MITNKVSITMNCHYIYIDSLTGTKLEFYCKNQQLSIETL